MAGLLEGVLPAIYSAGDTAKRRLGALLRDPAGTLGLGVARFGEDQQQMLNLANEAGYMPGSRSVLVGDKQRALARALLAQKATDAGAGMMQAATVWHGSPHRFDRFDSSKIGTGEGAQAYGHGIYLADAKKVADEYAGKLSKPTVTTATGRSIENMSGLSPEAKKLLELMQADADRAMYGSRLSSASERLWNAPQNIQKELIGNAERWNALDVLDSGNLYKVDLPDEKIAQMLDWDKPLQKQPARVQQAIKARLKDLGYSPGAAGLRAYHIEHGGFADATGETLAKKFFGDTPEAGAAFMRQQGIPGIRYLDGGSRNAGKGTYNYVVFPGEEGALTILERNGQQINALTDALRKKK